MRPHLRTLLTRSGVARATALATLLLSGAGFVTARTESVRAQTGPVSHPAIINPLLRAQMLQSGSGSRHRLRADKASRSITVIVRSRQDVSAAIHGMGGHLIADIKGRVLAARISLDRVNELARIPGVVELYPDETTHQRLDQSIPEIGA